MAARCSLPAGPLNTWSWTAAGNRRSTRDTRSSSGSWPNNTKNYSTLVALLAPIDNRNYGHFSLLEFLACGRYPFPRSATVRFLHRWPPGGKGGVSLQNGITYQLYRWHHLVAQRDGDQMELYIDGVLTRLQPLDPDRSTIPCRMLLGRLLTATQDAPQKNRPLVGRVDELALYEHPLSCRRGPESLSARNKGEPSEMSGGTPPRQVSRRPVLVPVLRECGTRNPPGGV